MSKKYTYTIKIGTMAEGQKVRKYHYEYGNTKGICIEITKNAISISCPMTVKYDLQSFTIEENRLFSDAIKKAFLVYLIIFSKNIESSQASLFVDDEYQTSIPVSIYSLFSGSLPRNMPAAWDSEKVIEEILTYNASKNDSKIASLFALICAKSKEKETERFMYLWMSINGVYNHIYNCSKKSGEEPNTNEHTKLTHMIKMYDIGEEAFSQDERKKISKHIISIITKNWNGGAITQESLSDSDSHQKIASAIKAQLKESLPNGSKEIEPYACLLIELPYYLRCSYFHANKPVLLYAFKDEQILKCLCALNETMEAFLDKELYKYFSGEYSETEIRKMLSKELTHV